MNAEASSPPAGFWRRLFSFLLDLAIVNLIYLLFLLIGMIALQLGLAWVEVERPSEDLILSLASPLFILWLALFVVYFTLFGYLGGQTPAKMLSGIQIQSITQAPLTWGQAIGRTIGYFLSSLFFGVGFLLVLFNRDRRALHDFLAGTCVVHQ
jgi:uncharacterized RDD family membrane protein YckC